MRCVFLFCLFFSFILSSKAADSLFVIRSIPMNARMMTVDELGNVYVVRNNNALVRFNENGDSSAFFRSVQNGEIGSVDASNPLRIVVYYPAYSRVTLLDRQLAQKNDLDLRRLNIANTSVVASSADGNLWIYDQFNARLRKVDEQLNEVVTSNDLRQETQLVPVPSFMIERDWKVFLCDTAKGIFIFDRYGNYVNTLSIYGVKHLQVFGTQLVYRHEDSLLSWDMGKVAADMLAIPGVAGRIINAAIVRNTMYVLYDDRLVLYRLKEE